MPKAAHASCETSVCSRQGFGEHASSRYRVLGGFACVIRKVSRQGAKNAKRTGTLLHSFWLNDTGPGNGPCCDGVRPREPSVLARMSPLNAPARPPQLYVAWSPDRATPGFRFAFLAALRASSGRSHAKAQRTQRKTGPIALFLVERYRVGARGHVRRAKQFLTVAPRRSIPATNGAWFPAYWPTLQRSLDRATPGGRRIPLRVLGGFACVIRKVSRKGAKNAKRTGTLLHSFWLNDTGPGNGPLFRRRSTPGAERPREVEPPECPGSPSPTPEPAG